MDIRARQHFEEVADAEDKRIKAASAELAECPFCGSPETAIELNRDDEFIGFCNDCHGSGPPSEYLDHAVSGWNHREGPRRFTVPRLATRQKPRLVPAA